MYDTPNMKAYSPDLRQRILDALDAGTPRHEVVSRFGVSLATLKRLLKQRREQGHVQPKPIPGPAFRITPEQQDSLIAQWRGNPDASLEQHCQEWQEQHKVALSPATMSRTFHRLGWTPKKSR